MLMRETIVAVTMAVDWKGQRWGASSGVDWSARL